MGQKTYSVGSQGGEVWRLDNHTLPWIDVSIPVNQYEQPKFRAHDVMTHPSNSDKVIVVGQWTNNATAYGTVTGIAYSDDAGLTWSKP